ncbi:MAG: LysR family transcriptional regulator [Armatimonadetes bacterium]|nr:LysR family transcriptional regulator [Armatimonadota bacterium]
MELFQLRSFLRAADEGSITRAAAALYLTQPAVTQHVRALERELGVPLFDRTGRGVALTPAGEALRRYARRSVALLAECRQVIADLEAGETGRLVLGAGVTTSIFHLPGCLRALHEAHPGIDVVVRTGRSAHVTALALEREVDLGLVTSSVQHPDLRVLGLYEEEILLVTPHDHPLAGRTVTPREVAGAPLILFPEGTGFREYLARALADAGITPRVKMESDSVEAIKSFVAVGLGVSFLPEAAAAAEIASGELARAQIEGLPPLKRRTSALYRTDRYLNAGARAFLGIVCERHGVVGWLGGSVGEVSRSVE